MFRKWIVCLCMTLLGCSIAFAAGTQVQGTVVDSSGAAIPGATVSLTDLSTNQVIHTTTSAKGQFAFKDVAPEPQLINIKKPGFQSFTKRVLPTVKAPATVKATMNVANLAQNVTVLGTVNPAARPVPSREDVMLKPETLVVLDRKQLETAGPVAGGAQMVSSTPGANVMGYGETGSTKYTIMLNGIQQGYAGEASGFTAPGSLGVTFDGVPISDPATGLWQSATMPQNLVMQNLAVTYGPGQPMNRWYNSVGGSIEFTPVQPTEGHHLSVAATEGPFGQQNFALVANTGNLFGWSTVVGGGVGRGDNYLQGPDGFGNHSKNGSVFGKTLKTFSAGSIELGLFYAKAGGYRPTTIPTTYVGLNEPSGIQFSQATSGFYNVLPYADYNKYDTNEMFLAYGRETLFLGRNSTLQNLTWYNHIRRFHRRTTDALAGGPTLDEWNNPHSNIFGDQVNMAEDLPFNTINFGGFLLHELYNTRNIFFNAADGGSGAEQLIGLHSKFRSGYFHYDNVAFYAQDDIHPVPRVHIIPGVRVVGFSTSYGDQAFRDFKLAPGVIPSTHCSLYPVVPSGTSLAAGRKIDPFYDIFGTPNASDQGSICGEHRSTSAVEPSIDASVMPTNWLTIYGGYDTIYHSPALGGGGGMFQKVDPIYYMLAKGAYTQFGGKVHFTHAPGLGNFIAGLDYFHLSYTNQELDFETATGIEGTSGGNSAYHGADLFFDADPASNIHIFLDYAGEAANFTTYVLGNSLAACEANPSSCTFLNNLPVTYVPNYTLNTGIYYGFEKHNHEIIEPRFWIDSTGSQNIWNNNTGEPSNQAIPSYTTVNLGLTAPVRLEKQSFNLQVDMLNLANSKYNQYAYISSGGYFASLAPNPNNPPSGYTNAYPGAPLSIYGTVAYHF